MARRKDDTPNQEQMESMLLKVITQAALDGDVSAAKWVLSRQFPGKWGAPYLKRDDVVPSPSPAMTPLLAQIAALRGENGRRANDDEATGDAE